MSPDFAPTGERIIVTGGADGIGSATVDLLLSRGAEVTVVDLPGRDRDGCSVVPCDLADPASIDAAVASLEGSWDALCNVAGVPGTRPAEHVIAVNFLGLRHLTDALLPSIRPGGAIVSVASTAGMFWLENYDMARELVDTGSFDEGLAWYSEHGTAYESYNLSKEAVIIYTLLVGARSREQGIRTNVVSPGPVNTAILPEFEDSMGKDSIDFVRGIVGRHAEPIDIGRIVAFLSSRDAGWIDGVNLVADGGLTNTMMFGDSPT